MNICSASLEKLQVRYLNIFVDGTQLNICIVFGSEKFISKVKREVEIEPLMPGIFSRVGLQCT